MSGCHYTGNVAHSAVPEFGSYCPCPCHFGGPMWVVGICCHCRRNPSNQTSPVQIISDNSMKFDHDVLKLELSVLRETVTVLQQKLEVIEKWKKTAKILCDQSKKPHKCPVCEGLGKATLFHDGICETCQGKGIVWG